LTSAVDGSEWSASSPGRALPPERTPGTHLVGGWVGLRAGLDTETKGKKMSAGDRTPIVQSGVRHCTERASYKLIYKDVYLHSNRECPLLFTHWFTDRTAKLCPYVMVCCMTVSVPDTLWSTSLFPRNLIRSYERYRRSLTWLIACNQ